MGRRTAGWLIRACAWLVPGEARAEWRAEWLAELHVRQGLRAAGFAAGAPVHAIWLMKEQWRSDMVWADIKYGWRQVRGHAGASASAIATLAVAIGAAVAIFSIVYGVLLKPLPYRDPSRLVQVWEVNPRFNWTEANVAPGNFLSWRDRTHTLAGMAWYFGSDTRDGGQTSVSLGADGDPVRVKAQSVSANFFDVLGVAAARGRTFSDDDRAAALTAPNRIVIMTDPFWRSQFNADAGIVGRTIQLNGRAFTVIGVLPKDFSFDNVPAQVFTLGVLDEARVRDVRRPHYLRVVARLTPGVTIDQARADLVSIAADLERQYPATNTQMSAGLGPLVDWFVGPSRRALVAFFAAVGLLLVIACVNVANLFLSRAVERRREMGVRAALGASRLRLMRQMLAESGVIAVWAGALGVALAFGMLRLFVGLAPEGLPRMNDIGVSAAAAWFAVVVTAVVTVVVGVLPAVQASRADLRESIGDGERTTSASSTLRRLLVAGEVALAVVLVAAATMTVRSFAALASVRPAFDATGLVSARVSLPGIRYGEAGQPARFFENLGNTLRRTAGVSAAGAVSRLPLDGYEWTGQLWVESRPDVHAYEIRHKTITLGYLETLGLPVLQGAPLAYADVASGKARPIVVNEALARQFFGATTAVGQRVAFDAPSPTIAWRTIVGVVADEPQDGLGIPAKPEIYDPEVQRDNDEMAVVMRSALPPTQALALLRRTIHEADPQIALYDVRSMDDTVWRSMARERLSTAVALVFAASALVLTAVGIYGVTAAGVAGRTRELAVRVAFGATRANIASLLMRTELSLIAIGALVGLAAAATLARVVTSMLYGVRPGDWSSYAWASLVLGATAAAACLPPIRRALSADPVTQLRVH